MAAALKDRKEFVIEFTQEEWDRFGICDVRKGDYIKSGDYYFRVAVRGDEIAAEHTCNTSIVLQSTSCAPQDALLFGGYAR